MSKREQQNKEKRGREIREATCSLHLGPAQVSQLHPCQQGFAKNGGGVETVLVGSAQPDFVMLSLD